MCAGASPGLVYLEQGGYRGRKGGRYVKTLVHPKSVEIPNGRSVSGVEGTGHSLRQIAANLGVGYGTVRARLLKE